MKLSKAVGILALHSSLFTTSTCFTATSTSAVCKASSIGTETNRSGLFAKVPPPGGLSFEEEDNTKSEEANTLPPSNESREEQSSSSSKQSGSTAPLSPFDNRGKLNEIDFCMSPSDVSLSRLYQSTPNANFIYNPKSTIEKSKATNDGPKVMSLTRALNNASNRAVRRILLSRSWPSPEALNMSLRQVLAANKKEEASVTELTGTKEKAEEIKVEKEDVDGEESSAKCPVPRPILNIIMKEQSEPESDDSLEDGQSPEVTSSIPLTLGRKGNTEKQWVANQLETFKDTYGNVQGYEFAEAYMECILSLATSGEESPRVEDVMKDKVYEDAYRRVLSVLKRAGVTFEGIVQEGENKNESRMNIAKKLRDDDICLSMLDKISIKKGKNIEVGVVPKEPEQIIEHKDDFDAKVEENKIEEESPEPVLEERVTDVEQKLVEKKESKKKRLAKKLFGFLYIKTEQEEEEIVTEPEVEEIPEMEAESKEEEVDNKEEEEEKVEIKPEDLGGVLLSKEEPTVTRQLNVLSNVVKRTLLFGGDQEILVLSKTLEADKPAFIKQWYPETLDTMSMDDLENESRPGVQYFNCLVKLLQDCYSDGVITTLDPSLPLSPSFANSYERLTALLAELGSGYIKPASSTDKIVSKKPQSAKEEFIRFSQWEVALRQVQPDVSDYPSDLVGSWQVKDEISGKTIGTTTVVFKPDGVVEVAPPLRGLKWRLDPGPTHLDTCTFQVLSEDGAILQYRGFMDRGARLESRFSKRSIKIRGAVSFQMRGSESEFGDRDILPIDTQPGTTRFVMSKVFDLNNN
ncbi:hypothetical protein CTEN210_01765 [Chaetoceros tenuissimus]|uniref:Plastid lipid-associated protein/fibrillin conserved domain-containing protein n=1 Tax=Chaetoceros tenuissimus TaxID=426638 RepID=A0AAD3CI57_9STRA|nr:hypothetical protein CTEN210_01765 [Chaetoceros tenuissimus]